MARTFTVTANFKPLRDLKLTDRALMREVGLLARERIVRRTISGLDENERGFTPYSRDYAARKAAELGGGGVNLQVSGAMLNAIVISEVTEDSVTLSFSS